MYSTVLAHAQGPRNASFYPHLLLLFLNLTEEQSDIHEIKYMPKVPGERMSILNKCYLIPKIYFCSLWQRYCSDDSRLLRQVWSVLKSKSFSDYFLATNSHSLSQLRVQGMGYRDSTLWDTFLYPGLKWFKNWGGGGRIWAQRVWGGQRGTWIQISSFSWFTVKTYLYFLIK